LVDVSTEGLAATGPRGDPATGDDSFRPDDPTEVALQLWSAAHGMAATLNGYCRTDATLQKPAARVAAHRQREDPWT